MKTLINILKPSNPRDNRSRDAHPTFYKIPPEIRENVVDHLGKRDLAALALTSKETYPAANRLLYSSLEFSFCRCSELYYDSLLRTLINHPELAALMTSLLIDMKVPCRVKTATPFDRLPARSIFRPLNIFIPAGDRRKHSDSRGQADWHKEALQTLSSPNAIGILGRLYNVERITIGLGLLQHSYYILTSLLNALPASVLPSLHTLKAYDAFLDSTALRSTTALLVLDLSFMHVDNAALCAVVDQNAHTLEEIRLCRIMEPTEEHIFMGYSGSPVKNLKVFASQGPHPHSVDGLQSLLGNASALEELRLATRSALSDFAWAEIFSALSSKSSWSARNLRVLKLGVPTCFSIFWNAAAEFLYRCGDRLTTLCIDGSSGDPIRPFPPDLLRYFSSHTQPNLTSLVLIWREETGLSPESAIALELFAPALEMLHICLSFPSNLADDSLGMIKPFSRLRRAYFVFLESAWPVGDYVDSSSADETARAREINPNGPIFQEFLRRAITQHEILSEVSWCIHYRRTFKSQGPKAYVKVNRVDASASGQPNATQANASSDAFSVEILPEECHKYETTEPSRFRCRVGNKEVLLSQRPGWREDMGSSLLDPGRICPYAGFNVSTGIRPPRREF